MMDHYQRGLQWTQMYSPFVKLFSTFASTDQNLSCSKIIKTSYDIRH